MRTLFLFPLAALLACQSDKNVNRVYGRALVADHDGLAQAKQLLQVGLSFLG